MPPGHSRGRVRIVSAQRRRRTGIEPEREAAEPREAGEIATGPGGSAGAEPNCEGEAEGTL